MAGSNARPAQDCAGIRFGNAPSYLAPSQFEVRGDRFYPVGDLDLVTCAENGVVREWRAGARVTHRNDAAMLPAVAGRRQLAYAFTIHHDRFAAPRECFGIVEREEHEALARRCGAT